VDINLIDFIIEMNKKGIVEMRNGKRICRNKGFYIVEMIK